jgi:hypothetical protein
MSSPSVEQVPQAARSLETVAVRFGNTMIGGFVGEQDVEANNLFAPELEQEPILQIGEVQGSEGIYNVTVLDVRGVKYLFGRKVLEAASDGQPDAGSLVMAELGDSRDIISTNEVWHPDDKDDLIEDPRAYQAVDGKTIIGVTVVRKAQGNRTFPGLISLNSAEDLLTEPFPTPRIIDKFGSGNHTTPLGGEVEGKNATTIDENIIMYRPDGKNHTLRVLEYTEDDVLYVGEINFPENIPGAEHKIGTTTPPEWINEREAFFVFHGMTIIDGKYVYSIHTARLLRQADEAGEVLFSVDNISREAILTPDSFPELTNDRQVELHPDIRRVTYSCGGIPTKNASGELIREELFVNQGDMRTWNAVVAADEIIGGWDRTMPAQRLQALAAA